MPFPNRGCQTCKHRRVKCDGGHPVCNRCQKANLVCHGAHAHDDLIFLNENEYVVGRRKRPRGPNTKPRHEIESNIRIATSLKILDTQCYTNNQSVVPFVLNLSPSLNVSLEDQAMGYYFTSHCEVRHDWPEIVDNHLMFALASLQSKSESILNFAICAVSYATFGRAQKNKQILAIGSSRYSLALNKINIALRDANLVTHDEVLLAAMLLSFYENSVTDKGSNFQLMASRSFTHHDGAMAVLKSRRQLEKRSDRSLRIDKLTRRQLLRSLLLRDLPVPAWLQDGSQYGEYGLSLKMDQHVIIAAKLRHQAASLDVPAVTSSEASNYIENLRYLLAEAQKLDDALISWAHEVPREDCYEKHIVQQNELSYYPSRLPSYFAHIYPTIGHAGMWNRYRGVRLLVNDVIIKLLRDLAGASESGTERAEEAARFRIQIQAEELCASIPYMLGLIKSNPGIKNGVIIDNVPALLKASVKANQASLLCWPLAVAAMIEEIPEQHQRYLKARLLDVSELVDDGLLERIASE